MAKSNIRYKWVLDINFGLSISCVGTFDDFKTNMRRLGVGSDIKDRLGDFIYIHATNAKAQSLRADGDSFTLKRYPL